MEDLTASVLEDIKKAYGPAKAKEFLAQQEKEKKEEQEKKINSLFASFQNQLTKV